MKMILVACALALGLTGCASMGNAPSQANISETAKKIQSYTRLACGFLPTVSTIAAILSRGASAGPAAIASDICAAVTTVPLADGPGHKPKVAGVVVHGKFVR